MADNIAIVMQQAIGDRNDPEVYEFERTYRGIFEDGTSAINARTGLLRADWATQSIERYNERIATETRRISDTGILYQSANQNNNVIFDDKAVKVLNTFYQEIEQQQIEQEAQKKCLTFKKVVRQTFINTRISRERVKISGLLSSKDIIIFSAVIYSK